MPIYNPAVTRDGAETLTNKTLTSPVLQGNISGWILDTNTWTYASASTFTISGDQTAIFTIGTKIKWTQTTVRYGIVLSSSYGAPNTTVTIQVNSDYVIANAVISANNYSYAVNPQAWPGWFALAAPSFTVAEIDDGAGGQPTVTETRICIEGRKVFIHMRGNGTKAGTSDNWSFTGTNWPIPANSTDRMAFGSCYASTSVNLMGVILRITGTYYYMIHASVTDNTAITNFGCIVTYEI